MVLDNDEMITEATGILTPTLRRGTKDLYRYHEAYNGIGARDFERRWHHIKSRIAGE